MTESEIQTRVKQAMAKIGAAQAMLFFGKGDQALALLKETLQELSTIDRAIEEKK